MSSTQLRNVWRLFLVFLTLLPISHAEPQWSWVIDEVAIHYVPKDEWSYFYIIPREIDDPTTVEFSHDLETWPLSEQIPDNVTSMICIFDNNLQVFVRIMH